MGILHTSHNPTKKKIYMPSHPNITSFNNPTAKTPNFRKK